MIGQSDQALNIALLLHLALLQKIVWQPQYDQRKNITEIKHSLN